MVTERVGVALRLGVLTAADGAALVELRPSPSALVRGLMHPDVWVAVAGADRAAATLAAAAVWLLAARIAVGLAAVVAGRLPGATGALARRVAAVALPRALYRLAAGAAGLGVLLSPAAAGATGAHSGPSVPAPRPPVSAVSAPQPPTQPLTTGQPARVVVRPGDSLWRIAADHLPGDAPPRRIAAAWPRWFAANRRVVGPDPDLIRPGQVLRQPADHRGDGR